MRKAVKSGLFLCIFRFKAHIDPDFLALTFLLDVRLWALIWMTERQNMSLQADNSRPGVYVMRESGQCGGAVLWGQICRSTSGETIFPINLFFLNGASDPAEANQPFVNLRHSGRTWNHSRLNRPAPDRFFVYGTFHLSRARRP